MDLEARVAELERQLQALAEIVNDLQAEKQMQQKRIRRAERIALLHSEDCTCTACLIYQINKEV